jgi:DNA-directed RNA polymerase subunit RPC12/RpoP
MMQSKELEDLEAILELLEEDEEKEMAEKHKKEEAFRERIELLLRAGQEGLILGPKGLIRKRCPKCGNRLSHQRLPYFFNLNTVHYYICPSCGYEFARLPLVLT